jgi:DNA-binding GntR family transcriptional regulator
MAKYTHQYTTIAQLIYMVNKSKKESGTLRLKAYRSIKDKIICLELKPGEKISENKLALELNVSRTPVREALLMLENEKLVICSDSFGFLVRRFSIKDVEEYYALRNIIEAFAIPLVVEKITPADIAGLQENLAHCAKVIQENDISAIIRCETEFHELLYRAARSEILFDTLAGLVEKFQWFRSLALSVPGAAAEAHRQHEKIVALIRQQDIEGLKKAMHYHIDEARGRVMHLLGFLL